MLYAERKRERQLQAAEAAGQSFWTQDFGDDIRTAVWHTFETIYAAYQGYNEWGADLATEVVQMLERRLLIRDLAGRWSTDYALKVYTFDLQTDCPSIIEAMWIVSERNAGHEVAEAFASAVNERLRQFRVAFELVEGQMIEKESQELHAEVVAPALRLLSGRAGWSKVENAYQAALGELHNGSPEDAITDAGTALQEALLVLGCKGNQIGDLLRDARKRSLLAAHDAKFVDGLHSLCHWVAADRSNKGDAHNADPALREDAWLTVHVVGSLILRLASGTAR